MTLESEERVWVNATELRRIVFWESVRVSGAYRSGAPITLPPETSGIDEAYAPLVIFFHGRGLGPETVSQVRRGFPAATIIAPQGGISWRSGHTWFLNERIGIAKRDSVAAAIDGFMAWLDSLILEPRETWLCGFSNGGAFAATLLLEFPSRFRGAALLSAPMVLPPWPADRLIGKGIFYAHGSEKDSVVPAAMFESATVYLRDSSGADVRIRTYDVGHQICDGEVTDLAAWFHEVNSV